MASEKANFLAGFRPAQLDRAEVQATHRPPLTKLEILLGDYGMDKSRAESILEKNKGDLDEVGLRALNTIQEDSTRKRPQVLAEIDNKKNNYRRFCEQFGENRDIGLHEDSANWTEPAEPMRYQTSEDEHEHINFKEYADRAERRQGSIHYVAGKCIVAISLPTFLESLREKDLKVFHLTNLDDEGLSIDDREEKNKIEEWKAELEPLPKLMKEIMNRKAEKVIVTSRRSVSTYVLTMLKHGWGTNMKQVSKAQALRGHSTTSYMMTTETIEMNLKYPMVTKSNKKAVLDKSDEIVKNQICWLFTSLHMSALDLDKPEQYAHRVHCIPKSLMGVFEVSASGESIHGHMIAIICPNGGRLGGVHCTKAGSHEAAGGEPLEIAGREEKLYRFCLEKCTADAQKIGEGRGHLPLGMAPADDARLSPSGNGACHTRKDATRHSTYGWLYGAISFRRAMKERGPGATAQHLRVALRCQKSACGGIYHVIMSLSLSLLLRLFASWSPVLLSVCLSSLSSSLV